MSDGQVQFATLRTPPPSILARRALLVTASLMGVATVVLFLSGAVSGSRAIPAALFILFLFVMAFLDAWLSAGTVHLDQTGLTVRRRTNAVRVPWSDVESMSVAPFCEEGPLRPLIALLVGNEANRRYVRVTLRRSLRIKLLPGPSGTRALGLPSGFLKSMGLYVENPDEVVEAARSHLQGAH